MFKTIKTIKDIDIEVYNIEDEDLRGVDNDEVPFIINKYHKSFNIDEEVILNFIDWKEFIVRWDEVIEMRVFRSL